MTGQKVKEQWCDKCDDYRQPQLKRWESSIAIVFDLECPICGEIFDRTIEKKSEVTKNDRAE